MESAKPSRPKPSNWIHQSPITVFIRNLKLLQLDLQPDWPDIAFRSLSSSSQNQRQRTKVIEWALYHLVALWDPETARDKLRPFFPPLEPLQSVNLRAALFRVLSDLKKNGDLGRETILRKSMLDDCKGEKFDELLAVFSTSVLRKVLTTSANGLPNPAIRLSTAKGVTPEEYQLMLPLILAHRVSLRKISERRTHVRNTHEAFSQLLANKKTQLDARSKENPLVIPKEVVNFEGLACEVKENWLSSEEWADTLLYGGARSSSDSFLDLPFETAWAKANESTVEDLTTSTTPDLLIDLESRILRQRDRLRRWREFGDSMQKKDGAGLQTSAYIADNAQLVFRDHQNLTIASISKAILQPVERTPPKDGDRTLLLSMNEALARISGKPRSSGRVPPPLRVPAVELSTRLPPEVETRARTSPLALNQQDLSSEIKSGPKEVAFSSDTDNRRASSPVVHISSEIDAEPKHDPRLNPFALVERTRKSMSLLPPPSSRPRETRRPRKSRLSFPTNQFETPPKQPSDTRASTPQDDLFEEGADYNSVFKSRPRVPLSPIASPAVHVTALGEFDVDMDADHTEDDDELDYMASPSARGRRV